MDKKQQQQKAPAAKSAAFEKAVEDSQKLKTKPTQDELLEVCGVEKKKRKTAIPSSFCISFFFLLGGRREKWGL